MLYQANHHTEMWLLLLQGKHIWKLWQQKFIINFYNRWFGVHTLIDRALYTFFENYNLFFPISEFAWAMEKR